MLDASLKLVAEAALGTTLKQVSGIGGGRNSRVYRLDTARGPYVLKQYHGAQRLDVEFAAFAFLRAKGLLVVPEALHADRETNCAIYECISGTPVSNATIIDQDISDCIQFVRDLKKLSLEADVAHLQDAAEAFFNLAGIEKNINDRVKRLEDRQRTTRLDDALDQFLSQEFLPTFQALSMHAYAIYKGIGLTVEKLIPQASRILSPSDFGFHNGIRTPTGMVFFDFEYFGWDDPAKLIADFLLHPGMDISRTHRERFVTGVLEVMNDPLLPRRLHVLLPLFGLKWCMILLNEFLNIDFARRQFAGVADERDEVLRLQLDKAKGMLALTLEYAGHGLS